jgi:nicotinamide mononucleotide transporter
MSWVEELSVPLSIEIVAVICNLIFIIAITYFRLWGWYFGIVGSLLSSYLFYIETLYSESILHLFYGGMGVYGFLRWTVLNQHSKKKTSIIYERDLPLIHHGYIIVFAALASFMLGYAMYSQTDDVSFPYLDASTTMFAIAATFMQAHKKLSSWYYWIIINAMTIYMYHYKGLYVYTLLAMVYVLLSFYGLQQWKKRQHAP